MGMANQIYDRVKETTTTTGTGTVTLLGATGGCRTFASVLTVGQTCAYVIEHQLDSTWECGIGTLASSSTFTRTTVKSSSNSNAAVSFASGTKNIYIDVIADSVANVRTGTQDFRLTTETLVPQSVLDRTAQTTIYLTPFIGNQIALYDGASTWQIRTTAEISLSLGTLTSDKNYDVFAYWTGTAVALEFSAAWSSDTGRTDSLTRVDGVLTKTSASTRRCVGTIRTTSTTTTEDSLSKRFVANVDNRLNRSLAYNTVVGAHNYNTNTTRQWAATASNQIAFVTCMPVDFVVAFLANTSCSSGGFQVLSVGLDTTTVETQSVYPPASGTAETRSCGTTTMIVGDGYHFVALLERATAAATTWNVGRIDSFILL
jgi:hypothetical protein